MLLGMCGVRDHYCLCPEILLRMRGVVQWIRCDGFLAEVMAKGGGDKGSVDKELNRRTEYAARTRGGACHV